MISWAGLALWEFAFTFPGGLTCTFLGLERVPEHLDVVAAVLEREVVLLRLS